MKNNPIKNGQEDKEIANRHKTFSTSLSIREIQIKTRVRCHTIPVRAAVTSEYTDNKCWRMRRKGTLRPVGGIVNYCRLWKTGPRSLRKLKIQLTYHVEISLLGIYVKKTKTLN